MILFNYITIYKNIPVYNKFVECVLNNTKKRIIKKINLILGFNDVIAVIFKSQLNQND